MNRDIAWDQVLLAAKNVAKDVREAGIALEAVFGVPRGGLTPAALVAQELGLPVVEELEKPDGILIVDDLIDSGATRNRFPTFPFATLFIKPHQAHTAWPNATFSGYSLGDNNWITFPWERAENETSPEDAVRRVLQFIGENPEREGLVETPKRVLKAFKELTAGYDQDAATHLAKVFDETSDQMVVSSGIEFVSLCEHHMLPFIGKATIGYLPDQKVVGLSKLARTLDVFARRLQVQERLTEQVADALMDHLAPLGCGVIIESSHACQGIRGAMKRDAMMTTSALRGAFLDDPTVRAEFFAIR